ncbi:MAG TPA: hypothetical protein VLA61_10825 [Ideonella sp.]|nr:hypothetical protein [Ideonella sp.]HSI48755.1 hypothetical protein [Ideonella sp.]
MSITYSRQQIIDVLCTLEELVVSLDRLGSATNELTSEQLNAETFRFLDEHDVFRKCARARRILSEAFDDQAGSIGQEELGGALQNVRPWKC